MKIKVDRTTAPLIRKNLNEHNTRAINEVWLTAKSLESMILDTISERVPKSPLVDRDRMSSLEDFLSERVKVIRRAPNSWSVGIFSNDAVEHSIVMIHEFGGRILIDKSPIFSSSGKQYSSKMRVWWLKTFGFALDPEKKYIDIQELRIFRDSLGEVPGIDLK